MLKELYQPQTQQSQVQLNNINENKLFKNCAPFTDCISEINNAQVDHTHDIHLVMPMCNLIEYSDIY